MSSPWRPQRLRTTGPRTGAGWGGRPRRPGRCPCCPAYRGGPGHAAGQAAWGRDCRSSRPHRGPRLATGERDGPYADPGCLAGPAAGGPGGRSGGQGGCQVPRPHEEQPHPHEPPQGVPAQGRLRREEATARPATARLCLDAQKHADGHHDATAATMRGRSRRGQQSRGAGCKARRRRVRNGGRLLQDGRRQRRGADTSGGQRRRQQRGGADTGKDQGACSGGGGQGHGKGTGASGTGGWQGGGRLHGPPRAGRTGPRDKR